MQINLGTVGFSLHLSGQWPLGIIGLLWHESGDY